MGFRLAIPTDHAQPGRQNVVLRAAYLRLHDLGLLTDKQPQLPSELMRPELARRLAAVLFQNEQLAQFNRGPVPIGALEDLHGGSVTFGGSAARSLPGCQPQDGIVVVAKHAHR